ncbi:IclR family transcriptional regulator [Mesorhizobium sp. YR577]|uniref:IclR family transcriptional regulator n=1 Tax=Mesorhizobium sp. YR577 TaxID=1884373 RepID=UPI0008EF06D7|nr:IclR family transcriptional regulator [Mesorhizobium sp. YR577]SFU19635.1 transcriptional regulator, IclR family [Mesorhizobium sp. YR577]
MDKTLLKGLTLIETLAHSDESRGVSSLARELQLSKSNVHRILLTLQSRNYVRRVDLNSTYELTQKIWELGSLVRGRLSLLKVSGPFIQRLSAETQESVHLSIRDGSEVVYIDKVEGTQPIAAYTRIGGRAPLYCVATGKAMLANLNDETLETLVPTLTAYTEHTILDYAGLREELARVREAGFAVNRGEWRADVFGVAAPVFDGSGKVAGAVGISGPSSRYKARQIKMFAAHVQVAAKDISDVMGYRGAR